MEELLKQIHTVARGMWKYRWPGLLVAWVVTAVGVVAVMRIPDQYEASARIYVDTQSILSPLMQGLAIQPNVSQQVSMLSRTLISRPNVEKLIRMADLDLGSTTKAEQEQLVTDLIRDLSINTAGRDSRDLYVVSYRNPDRDKAQRVVQSLVSIFVESGLGASRRDTATAKAFLDEQIRQAEQRMAEAELKLKEFRVRNIDRQLAAGGTDSLTRVTDLATQLDQARLQLREAENARNSIKAQLDAAAKVGEVPAPSASMPETELEIPVATPEIDARIHSVQRNLDELLLRYTERHPDVVAARRLLRDLEAQKASEVAELRKQMAATPGSAPAAGMSSGFDPSAMMQQEYSRMVAAADMQVATLRARVGEMASRYQQAIGNLRTSPALEAELAQLTREYGVQKKSYDDLVARRDTATMTGELEVAGLAAFRLIDPPRVSPQPVAPNRMMLMPLALLAGLGAALFLAFAASQLRPVFHDGGDLRMKTQLPLIGVVSAVMSDVARRRQKLELVKFWSASGSLVLLFMAGMAVMAFMAQRSV